MKGLDEANTPTKDLLRGAQHAVPAPILIFTYGNPSRGDDALGPALYDLLEEHKQKNGGLADVELLTDFQLQIEHAVDLERRQTIFFVDASVSCTEPFEISKLEPERDDSFTTHAMSPASVLAVYKQVNHCDPPPAYLLSIRAYEFGLGLKMSEQAKSNLQQAYLHILTEPW
jgi:hydrogenase maturation protease